MIGQTEFNTDVTNNGTLRLSDDSNKHVLLTGGTYMYLIHSLYITEPGTERIDTDLYPRPIFSLYLNI